MPWSEKTWQVALGHESGPVAAEEYEQNTETRDRVVLFGDGAGSNIWDALALVLIGGLLSSTLFVLTITPAVYHLLERAKAAAILEMPLAQAVGVPVGD